jgi:hypothetical protein
VLLVRSLGVARRGATGKHIPQDFLKCVAFTASDHLADSDLLFTHLAEASIPIAVAEILELYFRFNTFEKLFRR